jgi:hypothetical protein
MVTFTIEQVLQDESIKSRIIHKAIKELGTKAPDMQKVQPYVFYNGNFVSVQFIEKL